MLFLRDGRVVGQRHLGVKAVGQHPLVLVDERVGDPHVPQPQTRQLDQKRVGLRVQSSFHDVDQLDRALLAGVRLEQFLVTGADGPILQLAFDDSQAFLDLLLVHRRTIPAQQEFHDIGRHRILPAVPPHKILADEVAIEGRSRDSVQMVEFHVICHLPLWSVLY